MKRHVIIGRYGSADNINFIPGIDEIETHFDLLASSQNLISGQQFLDYGIGHAINELSGFGIYPSELGIDILVRPPMFLPLIRVFQDLVNRKMDGRARYD